MLIPFLGISQNYKLVDESYPEVVMKKIDNDTVSATLITSKEIIEGYVVYRQIKKLDDNHIYRFPESFLDAKKHDVKNVLYYESEKIPYTSYIINDGILDLNTDYLWQTTPYNDIMPSNIKIKQ